jgi:hypothetical protein
LIEKKTIEVTTCDLCGVEGGEAHIRHMTYLRGLGYEPSNNDPLAQKFKKLYKSVDVCDRCHARMDHNFLTLSKEEREQIVYAHLTEYDNRKDLRANQLGQGSHDDDCYDVLTWPEVFVNG